MKEREAFTPTKGVENEGYEFEVSMLAFYCLTLCCNEDIKDFKVAINDNHYQPFDDIVLVITTAEATEKYAIQLKHVKDKLLLTTNHFSKNGKMVLCKLLKFDFSKSDHVILLTNGAVGEAITTEDYSIVRKTSLTAEERYLNTSDEAERHTYEICDHEKSKIIKFYTCQKNRNDVDEAIRENFRTEFFSNGGNLEEAVQKFKTFFHQWKKGTFGFYKLDKEDIKMKIAEIVFYDHIIDYQPALDDEMSNEAELLQKVLNDFTITLIHEIDEEALKCLFRFSLNRTEIIDEGRRLLITFDKNDFKDQALVLWRLKKFPLMVKINNSNNSIIQKLINGLRNENLSFVLVGQYSREAFTDTNILVNLSDLASSSYYQRVIEEFQFSIQDQQNIISLKNLLECNKKFAEIITTKELFMILKGNFLVGEAEEELPHPYIPRRLLTPILATNSLDHFPKDLFAISGSSKILQQNLPKCTFFKFEEFVEIMSLGGSLPPKSIILCEEARSFATCLKYRNSNVHCLEVVDDDHLQLIYSKEKCEALRQFQRLPEDQLHGIMRNNINLICASSGVGKLTLLKYLRKNCPPGYWTVKVNLQENQHLQNDFQNDFTFESQVKNCFKEVHRVIYFFYGIDNLQTEILMKAIQYIQQLAEDNFRVWVFSQDYLKPILEQFFKVTSTNIEIFSSKEQKRYIKDRLQEHHVCQDLEKMLQSFKILKNNDILGTPMHLYMLTEIFINDPKARMEEVFLLTDLYKYFITTKYQHYFRKVSSECQNQIMDDGIYYRTEQYKLAAMSCLKLASFRNAQCDRNFRQQLSRIGDVVGIICKISADGSIIFSQQTYADYFAALWLVNNYQKICDTEARLLFHTQYKNIFFMFNLEICKNHPAHIAVLYQNFDQLQKCGSSLGEKDPLDRSTLHVACCYGTTPKLKSERMKRKFKFHKMDTLQEDGESQKILDHLMRHVPFDPLQPDALFHWDLLDYAFNVLNLYAIEAILVKFPKTAQKTLRKLQELEDDLLTVIYFCVKFGYESVLKLTSETSAFSSALMMENCNGENLLYISVKSGRYAIVAILLDQGARPDCVTSTYNKRSPLHLAVDCGHIDIVQLLLEKGACPDVMDRYRNVPLHLASSKGLLYCTQLLLKYGSDVNFADNFGRTALQLAATYGHINIIQLLVASGAIVNKCDRLGNSPLTCANDNKHSQIVNLLSENGVQPPVTLRRLSSNEFDEYTSHQMHWVAFTGQHERIDPLLEDGWSINAVDHFGRTPLYRAVTETNIKIVRMLINRGADVNIPDNKQATPLCKAIKNSDLEMTSLLLQNMSSTDVRDNLNRTPLHWAALTGDSDIMKLVLNTNPDLDTVDNLGRRPIDCAAEKGYHEIVAILDVQNTTL